MSAFDGMDAAASFWRIEPMLVQIDRGAGFCEDRGYGWSLTMEEKEGRAFIAAAFAQFARLRDLMPERARALAEGRCIGDVAATSELDAARLAFGSQGP